VFYQVEKNLKIADLGISRFIEQLNYKKSQNLEISKSAIAFSL